MFLPSEKYEYSSLEGDRFSVFRKIPSIVSWEKTSREKEEDSSLLGNFLARLQYLLRFSYTCFSPASIKATQLLSLSLSLPSTSLESISAISRAPLKMNGSLAAWPVEGLARMSCP